MRFKIHEKYLSPLSIIYDIFLPLVYKPSEEAVMISRRRFEIMSSGIILRVKVLQPGLLISGQHGRPLDVLSWFMFKRHY